MTLQIVKVRAGPTIRTHVMVGCLDLAVEFAAWCQGMGYEVELTEGDPEAHPYTPGEYEMAQALTRMYQHALASNAAKC
jgi:hypothetical protein